MKLKFRKSHSADSLVDLFHERERDMKRTCSSNFGLLVKQFTYCFSLLDDMLAGRIGAKLTIILV